MNCTLNHSLFNTTFGKSAQKGANMKNEQLNFGVVAAPEQLPVYSTQKTVNSFEPKNPIKPNMGEGNKLTAGKFSAGCAFFAMGLSAFSLLLSVIRKR